VKKVHLKVSIRQISLLAVAVFIGSSFVASPASADPILFNLTSTFETADPANIQPSHALRGVGLTIDGANPDTLLVRVYFTNYPKQSAFAGPNSILRVKLFSRFSGGISVADPFGDYWLDAPKRPYPSDGSWITADASSYLPGETMPGATRANLAECNPMTRMEPVIQPGWIDFSISMYCIGIPDNFLVSAYVDSNTTNAPVIFDYKYTPAPPMQVDISKVARPRSKILQVITINQVADMNAGANVVPIVAKVNSNKTVALASLTPNVCNFLNAASPNNLSTLNGGLCTVRGTVTGDRLYEVAAPVSMSFNIVKPRTVISFPKINDLALNVKQISIESTSNNGKPVLLRSLTPAVCAFQNSSSPKTLSLLSGGVCSVQAYSLGDATNDESEPITNSFNIVKTKSIITLGKIPDTLLSDQQVRVSGSSTGGFPVSVTSNTPTVCDVINGFSTLSNSASSISINLKSGGLCSLRGSSGGDAYLEKADDVVIGFNVVKTKPVLTLYSNTRSAYVGDFVSVAFTSSNRATPIMLSLTSSVCKFTSTSSPTSFTMISEGTCILEGYLAADSNYSESDRVRVSFIVTKQNQEFLFNPPGKVKEETDKFVNLEVGYSSELTPRLTSLTKKVCAINKNDDTSLKVEILSDGVCEIRVDQAGNDKWAAAEDLIEFTITNYIPPPPPPPPPPVTGSGSSSGTSTGTVPDLPKSTNANESATKPVPKKKTITCVKGKLVKKVTAVKPVCPSGYKKK
jgi:hypothetical protein